MGPLRIDRGEGRCWKGRRTSCWRTRTLFHVKFIFRGSLPLFWLFWSEFLSTKLLLLINSQWSYSHEASVPYGTPSHLLDWAESLRCPWSALLHWDCRQTARTISCTWIVRRIIEGVWRRNFSMMWLLGVPQARPGPEQKLLSANHT